MPCFTHPPPIQLVVGRPVTIELNASDPDGASGLTFQSDSLPAGLLLQDLGGGRAKLSGTPAGAAGDTRFLRWSVADPGGAKADQTAVVTMVAVASQGNSYGPPAVTSEAVFAINDRLIVSSSAKTWIFNLVDGSVHQTLNAGGSLSYANGYLLAAGADGALRAFVARSDNAKLAGLELSAGTLLPEFETPVTSYIATVAYSTDSLTVTPTTEHPAATVQVNGVPVASGTASGVIPLAVDNNTLITRVTAEDGIDILSYTIVVTRPPEAFVFNPRATFR